MGNFGGSISTLGIWQIRRVAANDRFQHHWKTASERKDDYNVRSCLPGGLIAPLLHSLSLSCEIEAHRFPGFPFWFVFQL